MNIDNNIENCDIGYCISKAFWNKGMTTEAFSAVINFAFKEVGFERISGSIMLIMQPLDELWKSVI